jgi:hypothetical protein
MEIEQWPDRARGATDHVNGLRRLERTRKDRDELESAVEEPLIVPKHAQMRQDVDPAAGAAETARRAEVTRSNRAFELALKGAKCLASEISMTAAAGEFGGVGQEEQDSSDPVEEVRPYGIDNPALIAWPVLDSNPRRLPIAPNRNVRQPVRDEVSVCQRIESV